jgi:putative NADPH-quinone reductase
VTQRICIIQGHPDSRQEHFGHALARAYADGAEAAGHEVRTIAIGEIEFPLLRSSDEWRNEPAPPHIAQAQDTIRWASHLVIVYPLWLGTMPAMLKAFLEQVLRPGFAFPEDQQASPWAGALKGRSARVIVTMGMPAAFYTWVYRAHSLKVLKRNILHFVGITPVRSTIIGMVEASDARRRKWLATVTKLGYAGR